MYYFRSGLHLILCYYALEDREKMKHAFTLLLNVPLDVDIEEEKYRITSVSLRECVSKKYQISRNIKLQRRGCGKVQQMMYRAELDGKHNI